MSYWCRCNRPYIYLILDQYLAESQTTTGQRKWIKGWGRNQPQISLSAVIGPSLAKQKYMSAYFFNLFNAMADESSPIICNGSSRYSTRVPFFFFVVWILPFPVWICSRNLCRTKKSTLWQTAHRPACILLFFLSAAPVSCPHFLLSLSFSPSRFCEESREGRQIRLPPQKLPITAWQRVQHCCLANAEFVNPGSTAANMWAQFWACRFKWVKRRGVAIYRHSSGIWNKLRWGCSWFLHLKWVRSQGIHHRQRSTPDLYWLTIPQYIYI